MNKKEMLLIKEMVDKKCRNYSCKHFSHCGCMICNVFVNKPLNCEKFIPTKPKPIWIKNIVIQIKKGGKK